MNSKLLLGLALVTVAAAAIAYYTIAALKPNGLGITDNGFSFVLRDRNDTHPMLITNNVDFINKQYAWHLIPPTWMPNVHDQFLIQNWLKTEKATRLGLITVLWVASSGIIILRHARKQREP